MRPWRNEVSSAWFDGGSTTLRERFCDEGTAPMADDPAAASPGENAFGRIMEALADPAASGAEARPVPRTVPAPNTAARARPKDIG